MALTLGVVQVCPVQAVSVTYDVTLVVTEGWLAGKTFDGSFTYDDAVVTGVRVEINFFGENYTEIADIDYPEFPQLIFKAGEI
ncbi:MAG: hypothetical protein WBA13_10655 [Microcoleaceae cyanobacterium]